MKLHPLEFVAACAACAMVGAAAFSEVGTDPIWAAPAAGAALAGLRIALAQHKPRRDA